MATRVTLPPLDETSSGDPASVVPVAKVRLQNDRADREAEANWLEAAARPGVVELLSVEPDPFTIVTAHAGARTLRTARLAPLEGLELMAATADLLAGLHRDGFVHGKLTVDHVIVGPNGPVLCSPDGTATEPTSDVDGLARCMTELGRQWDDSEATVAWRPRWNRLAERLADTNDPARSATRAAAALRRLAPPNEPPSRQIGPTTHRRLSGSVAAAVLVVLTLAGLAIGPQAERSPAGPQITIDGSTYAVGRDGDDVVHLRDPCDPSAPVLLLRPSTGEVFAFATVGDRSAGVAVAVVPGADELRAEFSPALGCDVAVARGLAGATSIDTRALSSGSPDQS